MVRAVVLIKSPLTLASAHVKKIDGVEDAYDLRGRFDCVAYVNVKEVSALRRTIFKIQAIKGISKTETLIEI